MPAKLLLKLARQCQAVVLLQQPGRAALARLAVDADNRFVATANIRRIERQIGHLPDVRRAVLPRGKPFLNRVLMRAGKGGKHQFTGVRVARRNRQLITLLDHLHYLFHLAKLKARRNTLGVEIERQRHQIGITGALAVAKQAAFNPLCACQQRQLGAGNTGAAIVMGMHADAHLLTARKVATEVLNLVGIDIGHAHFNGGRQVDDHRPRGIGLPDIGHRFANRQRELRFGKAEGLR